MQWADNLHKTKIDRFRTAGDVWNENFERQCTNESLEHYVKFDF